jgi:hypothetical protein
MTIGGYDVKEFRNKSETLDSIVWLSNTANSRVINGTGYYLGWSRNLSNVYYGGSNIDDGSPNVAVYDPFERKIMFPTKEWDKLSSNWTRSMSYMSCDWVAGSCQFQGRC